jgi:hypothetical protein
MSEGASQEGKVMRWEHVGIDVLVKLRSAFERGDDVTDVDLLMSVSPATGCSEHSSRATTLRGRFQLVLVHEARKGTQFGLAAHRMVKPRLSAISATTAPSAVLPACAAASLSSPALS